MTAAEIQTLTEKIRQTQYTGREEFAAARAELEARIERAQADRKNNHLSRDRIAELERARFTNWPDKDKFRSMVIDARRDVSHQVEQAKAAVQAIRDRRRRPTMPEVFLTRKEGRATKDTSFALLLEMRKINEREDLRARREAVAKLTPDARADRFEHLQHELEVLNRGAVVPLEDSEWYDNHCRTKHGLQQELAILSDALIDDEAAAAIPAFNRPARQDAFLNRVAQLRQHLVTDAERREEAAAESALHELEGIANHVRLALTTAEHIGHPMSDKATVTV